MLEPIRCPNCGAPLLAGATADLVACAYCGQSSRVVERSAPAPAQTGAQATLTESVALVTPRGTHVVLVAAGTALPASRTETLSTGRDDQEALDVELVAVGTAGAAAPRALVHVSLPLRARGPRGTARATLTVAIALSGAVSVALREPGDTSGVVRDGLQVAVR